MPAYNCKKYIKQAIESVKEQTYKNWELLIIDDCSTDNTRKIIEDNIKDIKEKVVYIKSDKKLKVANARNKLIEKSKGQYIAFLDSDDIWKNDKLEKQIQYMEQNDYGFTYTSYIYLKNNRKKKVKKVPVKLTYEEALGNTIILTSTVIIDTNKINKELIKFPDIKSEDTATWWKILKKGYVAYGLNEKLTIYRIIKGSLSYSKKDAINKIWNLYRKEEKLSIMKAYKCFILYSYHAILKRVM